METRESKSFDQKHTNLQSSSNASGMSNQSGTTGMGGLKNIGGRLQQFGTATADRINHLSTTQKVVGGSLLALGAGWITMSAMHKDPAGMLKNTGRRLADTSNKFLKREGRTSA